MSVARGAGDAGRDHAAAEVVSVPPRQDLVLVPHRDRAAAGADGAEAAGAQSQGRAHRRAVPRAAAARIGPAPKAPQQKASWFWFFRGVDNVLRAAEPLFPQAHAAARHRPRGRLRHRAAQRRGRARRDFPGDGQQRDDVRRARLSARTIRSAPSPRKSIDKLLVVHERRGLLPALRVADLGHRARLPRAAGGRRRRAPWRRCKRGLDWLAPQQMLDVRGDWVARRPRRAARRLGVPIRQPALSRCRRHRRRRPWRWTARRASIRRSDYRAALARAREWIVGMQSANGGWGAFDADNAYLLSQQHSVRRSRRAARSADRGRHRALRVDAGAARRDAANSAGGRARASTICARTQQADGSWFGRWGMNYIYGTWSVLCALNAAGVDHAAPEMRKARRLAASRSRTPTAAGARTARATSSTTAATSRAPSTASQTAWALLGLMAAGDVDHPAVARGIAYLHAHAGRRRLLGRAALHRDRFPARVLSALPRLSRNSSRCGRWRATAISKAAMRARWRSGCSRSEDYCDGPSN